MSKANVDPLKWTAHYRQQSSPQCVCEFLALWDGQRLCLLDWFRHRHLSDTSLCLGCLLLFGFEPPILFGVFSLKTIVQVGGIIALRSLTTSRHNCFADRTRDLALISSIYCEILPDATTSLSSCHIVHVDWILCITWWLITSDSISVTILI